MDAEQAGRVHMALRLLFAAILAIYIAQMLRGWYAMAAGVVAGVLAVWAFVRLKRSFDKSA